MQLHVSPSLRHVTLMPGKDVREFIKVRVGPRWASYRMLFYSLLFFAFLVRFTFVLSTVDAIDGDHSKCSNIGCLGKRIGPKILGRRIQSHVPEVIYRILDEPVGEDEVQGKSDLPQTLQDFMAQIKESRSDAKSFALKLRQMVLLLEQRARKAKIQEYLYRHVASSCIPKQLHCLALKLANEHSNNAAARLQLPSAELVPALIDNSYFHFVLASDNVLAASVVATSLVKNALRPSKFRATPPAVIEVKALHQFDWLSKGKIPVLEAMEKDQRVRSKFRGGSSAIVANNTEKPQVIAAKLQALSPKYNSMMNHIRIHLPELFPSLNKVVFLDDDIVIQTDLSPLWDVDMKWKVNGAVETCRGEDSLVMSKRFKSYLNFSHPLIANSFDPNECAWAYGMNIFDLKAWRKSNITRTYYHWLEQNLKSDLSLWQLGTLPPGLIAFRGQVRVIDPFWHMLGLGYQENTTLSDAETAGVIHFNGRAKPWLDIAFPQLRPLWAKYINFSDKFIKGCHIRAP
ncbi:putative galacturonosyltransferase 12 [Hibiscus syriacus]|uniref:Hexosyltransferase n=1 Tax=Hibiscus syriacus TaxID=106335 RepID=A0A6A3CYZ3_HIBSY|nr:putative galacturonosyltransferase 12 [Hibiscus syriacus]